MMKTRNLIAGVGILAMTLSLGGCFEFVTDLEANLASPNAIAAAATLKSLSQATVCALASGALELQSILEAENAGKAATIAGKFVTATDSLCVYLGGTPSGSVSLK